MRYTLILLAILSLLATVHAQYTCYNVTQTRNQCSGHGICVGQDNCTCNAGYYGLTCNSWDCGGIPSINTTVCSGNGICRRPNSCVCYLGYKDANCSTAYSCFGILATNYSSCSSVGDCLDTDLCSCPRDYTGSQCQIARSKSCYSFYDTACNGNGYCDSNYVCQCADGFSGSDCQISGPTSSPGSVTPTTIAPFASSTTFSQYFKQSSLTAVPGYPVSPTVTFNSTNGFMNFASTFYKGRSNQRNVLISANAYNFVNSAAMVQFSCDLSIVGTYLELWLYKSPELFSLTSFSVDKKGNGYLFVYWLLGTSFQYAFQPCNIQKNTVYTLSIAPKWDGKYVMIVTNVTTVESSPSVICTTAISGANNADLTRMYMMLGQSTDIPSEPDQSSQAATTVISTNIGTFGQQVSDSSIPSYISNPSLLSQASIAGIVIGVLLGVTILTLLCAILCMIFVYRRQILKRIDPTPVAVDFNPMTATDDMTDATSQRD